MPISTPPLDLLLALVADLLSVPLDSVRIEHTETGIEVKSGWRSLIVEWAPTGGTAHIAMAIERLKARVPAAGSRLIPLIFTPHMGSVGRELCTQAQLPWVDTAGNAHIVLPGMLVRVEGRRPIKKQVGRPSNAFAARSSRISRVLLLEPTRAFSQRELARSAGVDEGFTSRIVQRLEQDQLVLRDSDGVRVRDTFLMLEAWRETWNLARMDQCVGHVDAQSPEELLRRTSASLSEIGISHALTGISAARWTKGREDFPEVVFLVDRLPEPDDAAALRFHADAVPQNIRFIQIEDPSYLWGGSSVDDVQVAHPVQIYLDLKGRPNVPKDDHDAMRTAATTA